MEPGVGGGKPVAFSGNIPVLNPLPPHLWVPTCPFYETPLGSGPPPPVRSLVGALWSPHLSCPLCEGRTVDFR